MIISSSLSPNTESDDVALALRVLFSPHTWLEGTAQKTVEDWFEKKYPGAIVVTFNSGRSSLFALLDAFDIGNGHEVIVQAFTCVAVPNAVLWMGATPVYADIDDTYNMDIVDLEKKITEKTKAIIVQHTFGIPANIEAIIALSHKHNLVVIEDCAHCLGSSYKGKQLGSFGDAAFFSFGRDKVVSSVWGGAGIISAKWKVQSGKLKRLHDALSYPSKFWIVQQLLHPIAFSVILPLYQIGMGKLLLVCLQKLKLLSYPVYPEEKRGQQPTQFPKKYPNALAELLIGQLNKLERYQKQRHDALLVYMKRLKSNKKINELIAAHTLGLLRFPLIVENSAEMRVHARDKGILLGNWYHHVIDPAGVDLIRVGYKRGWCPKAEYAAAQTINLPTRISSEQVGKVIHVLNHE